MPRIKRRKYLEDNVAAVGFGPIEPRMLSSTP